MKGLNLNEGPSSVPFKELSESSFEEINLGLMDQTNEDSHLDIEGMLNFMTSRATVPIG